MIGVSKKKNRLIHFYVLIATTEIIVILLPEAISSIRGTINMEFVIFQYSVGWQSRKWI